MNSLKIHKVIWILLAISIIGTFFVYPALPEEIPLHWNAAGEVDRIGHKINAFLTAGLPLLIVILLSVVPKIDPKRESYQKHGKAYGIIANLLIVFFIGLHWVTLAVALGYSINVGAVVGGGVGILFIIIGNYMGQIRPNYTFGIRTPWTLANEEVWKKTHRLGSWAFIVLGVLFIISGIIANEILFMIIIGALLLFVLGLFIYSYLEYRKIEHTK